jgi:uncharacterized membrane protein
MLSGLLPKSLQRYSPLLAILTLSSLLSVVLFLLRYSYAGRETYYFLNWNLFLAWIPLFFALAAWHTAHTSQAWRAAQTKYAPSLKTLILIGGWLLFLPNCPYIVTDLMHLVSRPPVPIWFDAAMFFSYAWNGLILGVGSLWIIQKLVGQWFGRRVGWLSAALALVAASFGVYLGRSLRWNSWDVFLAPRQLIQDILYRITHPLEYTRALGMTALFSSLLIVVYLTLIIMAQVYTTLEAKEERPRRY